MAETGYKHASTQIEPSEEFAAKVRDVESRVIGNAAAKSGVPYALPIQNLLARLGRR